MTPTARLRHPHTPT
ncbi:hypothetical protein STRIP9103_07644, partial [Streptomyces ipomoeae 91-03]